MKNKNKRKSSFSSHFTVSKLSKLNTLNLPHKTKMRYIMLDKYLKGGLFHPAEPFQPTDETETAATGKELKCEQNTEMSAEYESVQKLFSEKVFLWRCDIKEKKINA